MLHRSRCQRPGTEWQPIIPPRGKKIRALRCQGQELLEPSGQVIGSFDAVKVDTVLHVKPVAVEQQPQDIAAGAVVEVYAVVQARER
jgi:hypothetical protein